MRLRETFPADKALLAETVPTGVVKVGGMVYVGTFVVVSPVGLMLVTRENELNYLFIPAEVDANVVLFPYGPREEVDVGDEPVPVESGTLVSSVQDRLLMIWPAEVLDDTGALAGLVGA